MTKLFGTDGVRGIANIKPMDVETATAIGRAVAYLSKKHEHRHRIVIGKDTRLSGYMIENALTAGICSMGVDVLLVGPLPTPATAYITQSMRADAGIMISASHNPYQDNGIKIFTRDGYKLSYNVEEEIKEIISSGRINTIRPTAQEIGRAHRIDDALGRYIVFCKQSFPEELSLEGLNIVLDCSNGAAYKVAPTIFKELGANVHVIHNNPNGFNINDNCGSEHTESLRLELIKHNADIGLAMDGDADRLIVIDEKGEQLDGDCIITICAQYLHEKGLLSKNRVVTTAMSNIGLRIALENMDIKHYESAVGDRNVLEMMHEVGATLGGEQSGHLIFLDHHRTGDACISALQLLRVLQDSQQKVSEIAQIFQRSPQKLINVEVTKKTALEELETVQAVINSAQQELGAKGRVLVRYSGTQNICRVMVEGADQEQVERLSAKLALTVQQELN